MKGGEKAFIRLQEEILKESSDESIFAWDTENDDAPYGVVGMLATHPRYFKNGAGITSLSRESRHNPQGLRAGHVQMKTTIVHQNGMQWAYLNCTSGAHPDQKMAAPVNIQEETADGPVISRGTSGIVNLVSWRDNMPEDVLFLKRGFVAHGQTFQICRIRYDPREIEVIGAWPSPGWKAAKDVKVKPPEDDMPLETYIDLDLRLARAMAQGKRNIPNAGNLHGSFPAALAFDVCRQTT